MTGCEQRRNIVLTGFMGTGKTSVAREVAQRLGRTFVDMDEVIVQRAGRSIGEIFAQEGEAAFRLLERALCEELAQGEGLVIATGGGALVDPQNREVLARNGLLICLDCAEEELLARLQGDRSRPLLLGEDPAARLRALLAARRAAYAQIPYHVDTTNLALPQVVEAVMRLAQGEPTLWQVPTPTGSYPVQLVPGGLELLGAWLRAQGIGPLVVVSDAHVWPLYGDRVMAGLGQSRYAPSPVVLPPGEETKTLDTVRLLYDRFVEAGLDRSGAVIALGGGVISDMAGFAAATFMRGVPLVAVPTTLLAMVDASIGGKVAVDHPKGKNLIGAFIRPLLVLADPETLATLPDLERRAGLAEILKAGLIADPQLFAALEPGAPSPSLRWLVERAIQVKVDVVAEDPYERGRRAVLNLGHTFAHAFELLSGYRLHHGLAVSIGLAAAAHLAELRGLLAGEARGRILAALLHHNLPIHYGDHPPDAVYRAMQSDKKRRAGRLRFILPRAIGEVVIVEDVTEGEVLQALERIRP